MKKLPFIRLSLVLIAGMVLGACTPSIVIDVQKTFQGYPCGSNCSQFQQGFELARNRQYKQVGQCNSVSPDLQLGCQSYIHEYTVENVLPPYYQFASR